ncbi:acid protease [Artomyces pyxidatus]|uniref:Acid protease n=1 Tax=Artomyces pyxidatus TaxID=48021 RepID=A0ACB8TES3_9AGAM|nr:acid protease [Artomyces pyxidatus]
MLPLLSLGLSLSFAAVLATPVLLDIFPGAKQRGRGVHVPLYRREMSEGMRRREMNTGAIGLGDALDVTYNVLIQVGETSTPVVLDTGSADLWVLSSACSTDCFSTTVPLYPVATFQATGLAVQLMYGDSQTGTHADGPIGKDTAGLANFSLDSQYFAAISSTNTSVLQTGSAGIFGLGFPLNSVIWNQLLSAQYPRQKRDVTRSNFATRIFPDLSFLSRSAPLATRQSTSPPSVSDVLATFSTNGPLISRLASTGILTFPGVTITLQRDTVDVGGNQGMLSIGELPSGLSEDNLTWVPLRGYTVSQGGLPAPADSPTEVYPLTWEIPIDDVFFDGQKLPRSNLSASNISLSALIDTGNSLMRGPQDVIQNIIDILGGNKYPCADAHTLGFQIGGKLFTVDPRDFGTQAFTNEDDVCTPSLASTDPPGHGFLYSWSLGDPFLKSVLATFYYGNLTYPSHDQPRIGLLSTVPADAAQQLKDAVNYANISLGGNLPATSEAAPTGTLAPASTNANGVPQAHESGVAPSPSASSAGVGAGGVSVPMPILLGVTIISALCSTLLTSV